MMIFADWNLWLDWNFCGVRVLSTEKKMMDFVSMFFVCMEVYLSCTGCDYDGENEGL